VGKRRVSQMIGPVTVGAASQEILGFSENRVGIVLFTGTIAIGGGAAVQYTFGKAATNSNGFTYQINQPPFFLDIDLHGDIVRQALFAFSPAGTPSVVVIEVLEVDEIGEDPNYR